MRTQVKSLRALAVASGGAAALCSGLPSLGWAQAPSPTTAASGASDAQSSTVGEVVVTAQKRVERLQKVPISAEVASGAALQAEGVQNLQQVTGTIPDVFVVESGPSDRLFVRGIGSADNFSVSQSVATFIDGVYHCRSRTSDADFLDIDRVELLKGPQSVFFGNSAIGGALNVTTRQPTQAPSVDLFASYNPTFGNEEVEGAVSGPIANGLTGRLAANYSGGDGYLYDTSTGQHLPVTNDNSARGQLRWTPTDRLTIELKAEAGAYHQQGGLLLQPLDCPPPAGFSGPAGFCKVIIGDNLPTSLGEQRTSTPGGHQDLAAQEFVLNGSYDFGFADLTSTTAYLHHKLRYSFDSDGPVSSRPTRCVCS